MLLAALVKHRDYRRSENTAPQNPENKPFRSYLAAIVIMQIVLLAGVIFPAGRDFIRLPSLFWLVRQGNNCNDSLPGT